MNGIDISAHQDGINLSKVDCDFVVVKATEGTDYVNRCFTSHSNKVIKLGRLYGMYHYANGGDVQKEADYFLDKIKKFIGKGIIALDWEAENNPRFGRDDAEWCEAWCNYVYHKTGIKPFIYVQKSMMDKMKSLGYPLWIAQYPDYEPTGFQKTPWNEGVYDCAIRQYTSVGRLSGYNGNLDLDKAYISKATWQKYAGVKVGLSTTSKPTTATKKKSISIIAKEVLAGKWGNGDDRKNKLTKAGYDYNKVQAAVNKLVKASQLSSEKIINAVAHEVIAGKWGKGQERIDRLKAAGYDPEIIQKRVNSLLE